MVAARKSAPAKGPLQTVASLWKQARGLYRVMRANPLSFVGFVLVAITLILAVIVVVDPSLIIPYGATQDTGVYREPPTLLQWPPSIQHPFGTDQGGRDIYSSVLLALPLDLGIGIGIAGISVLLGGFLGLVAGFWDKPGTLGGACSTVIMRTTDVFLAFPSLILALAIVASIGRGVGAAFLAIVTTWWPFYVRLVRGEVLAVKHLPYVTAARAAGVRETRILTRHVLRNVLDPIIVYFTLDIGTVLVTFSTISFVGAGIPYPGPVPEWGSMMLYYQGNFLLSQDLVVHRVPRDRHLRDGARLQSARGRSTGRARPPYAPRPGRGPARASSRGPEVRRGVRYGGGPG